MVLTTLCGPTAAATYTWSIPADTISTFSAVFESDAEDNGAAGAWLGDVRRIRTQPTNVACVKEPSSTTRANIVSSWKRMGA